MINNKWLFTVLLAVTVPAFGAALREDLKDSPCAAIYEAMSKDPIMVGGFSGGKFRNNPLRIAAERGDIGCVQDQIRRFKDGERDWYTEELVDINDNSGHETALCVAVDYGSTKVPAKEFNEARAAAQDTIVAELVAAGAKTDGALWRAARNNRVEAMRILANAGNIEKQLLAEDSLNGTALHNAARRGASEAVTWILEKSRENKFEYGWTCDWRPGWRGNLPSDVAKENKFFAIYREIKKYEDECEQERNRRKQEEYKA